MPDLKSVQYLRAAAALMIVLYHLEVPLGRMGYSGYWPHWLAAGVDAFFVISGLVMWITTSNRPAAPLSFYGRRIVRIVPLYWIMTSVLVGVMLAAPGAMQTARFDLHNVVASYLFIPSANPGTGLMEPVLVPGWTLNYEMFFYLIFGAALLLPAPARLPALIATLSALCLYGLLAAPASPVVGFYTSTITLEFALGLLLGRLYERGWTAPDRGGWLLLAAGAAGIPIATALQPDWPRLVIWGLPAAVLLLGAVSLDRRGAVPGIPALRLLGDASYSIYLSHGIALAAAARIWGMFVPAAAPGGLVLFAAVAVPAAVLGGVVLYFAVERPIIRSLKPGGPRAEVRMRTA